MAKVNIEIYVDDPSNDEKLIFAKTPSKNPSKMKSRIPLTPAKTNFATTPGRDKLLNVQGNHPKFLSSAKKATKQEHNLLPEIETSSRLNFGLAKLISEIDLDELEVPELKFLESDEEQEIDFLTWKPIELATRKQNSIRQEILEYDLDVFERPCYYEEEDSFVISLDD